MQSYAYTLDPAGKRTAVAENGGTTRTYAYDSIDRLTGEAVTGSLTYAKTFAYDPVGNRSTQTTTGTGAASVTYTYDTRDRLTQENATSYAYDPNGDLTHKAGEASYTWDFENRLLGATMNGGATVNHTYDADGNRVQTAVTPIATAPIACSGNTAVYVQQDTMTQGSWRGAYGADGQYIAQEPAAAPSYGSVTFSSASNYTWAGTTTDTRALQQPPPQTSRTATAYTSYTSETLHVTTTDSSEHTVALYMVDFDSQSRAQTVAAKTTTGTVLDAARAFSNFTGGVWVVYRVCGSVDFVFTNTGGSGVNAVVSGVFFGPPPGATAATNFLVDTSGGLSQVVVDTDGAGNLTAYYVRVGDELLEVVRPGSTAGTWSTRFVYSDGLGSVRVLTDESGTTIDSRAYEAFGTKNVEAGSDPLTYGFAGEPFEGTSKLAYHRARWMDARGGRFEGMDPKGASPKRPVSLHRYLYAGNEPVDAVDPTGRDFDLGGIGAAVDIVDIGATLADASTGLGNALTGGGQRLYLRWHSLTRNWLVRALGAHAYVVDDDGRGNRTVFEGEAEDENATIDFGRLTVWPDRTFPGESQNSPGDHSIPIPTIGTPNPKACLEAESARINAIPNLLYSPFGPNSNTVAHDLVKACGLDMDAPDWRLFGWNDELRPYDPRIDNPFWTD